MLRFGFLTVGASGTDRAGLLGRAGAMGETCIRDSDNQQNQVTSATGLTSPVFDHKGNMSTDQGGRTYTFDASVSSWPRPSLASSFFAACFLRRLQTCPGSPRHGMLRRSS